MLKWRCCVEGGVKGAWHMTSLFFLIVYYSVSLEQQEEHSSSIKCKFSQGLEV